MMPLEAPTVGTLPLPFLVVAVTVAVPEIERTCAPAGLLPYGLEDTYGDLAGDCGVSHEAGVRNKQPSLGYKFLLHKESHCSPA